LSIEDIGNINKPIFWTLHDFWPVQGTAHHSESLNSYSASFLCQKIDAWVIKRKKNSWLNKKIKFIAPSSWVYDVALDSPIGKFHNIEQIHHGIDTCFWKPIPIEKFYEPETTRSKKTLDILFAAPSAFADPNKGFLSLLEAAKLSVKKDKNLFLKIIVVDSAKDIARFPKHNQILFKNIARPDTDTALRTLYNSADIVCAPSKQETFGLVALEAQACGKPVLAFNFGGVKDIVIHNVTGYLAEPFSAKSLGALLNQLAIPEVRVRMGKQARINIKNKFEASYAAERMITCYHRNIEKF
jgi:glycosyltransferase involved in cell wall biosynthesis